MKKEVDQILKYEQADFRQERSCTNKITTLRIIIELTIKWQTLLYLTFIDLEKAFDSIQPSSIMEYPQVLRYSWKKSYLPSKNFMMDSLVKLSMIEALQIPFPYPLVSGKDGYSPLLFFMTID